MDLYTLSSNVDRLPFKESPKGTRTQMVEANGEGLRDGVAQGSASL